jgi:hypothetical protein
MLKAKYVVPILTALLSGCGTYVPEVQEYGDQTQGQALIQAIVHSIHCELRNTVTYVINQDKYVARLNQNIRSSPWFDDWGVQIALTLTIDEKTTINPTFSWVPNPVTAIFTLAGGPSASADAMRIVKMNYFYTVQELYKPGPCTDSDKMDHPLGSLLIQGDLKTREFLESQLLAIGTGEIKVSAAVATPASALSQQVIFDVNTAANITPSWKFLHVQVNKGGTLFSTSRDRKHDLLMTFGPADKANRMLLPSAADAFRSLELGSSINRGVIP